MTEENLSESDIDNLSEDELMELLSGQSSGHGYPKPPKKDSIFRFFREILRLEDSSKVANLNNDELGKSKLSTRAYLEIGDYARRENLDKVAKYLEMKAEITAKTSMGRKGFLAQLFVTQIKKEQKIKPSREPKKRWFQSNPKLEGESQ